MNCHCRHCRRPIAGNNFPAHPRPRALLLESPSEDLHSPPARVFTGSVTRRHSKLEVAVFAQKSLSFCRLFTLRFRHHSNELPAGVHTNRLLTSSRAIPSDQF
ncbi:hypothetical protein Salat_2607300 [Sesamum alatum]|uniref:Uncharacterized protein n=1 Tax=Sesamum alatum TaxID=300844 RepID=A0AAE1XP44_9LAMI|nr:hypothetical protein Salat_2607300 [Sesamum alatum]